MDYRKQFRVKPGQKVRLSKLDPGYTGKLDSDMAAKLSLSARAGHPCGEDFIAAPFLSAHPEYSYLKPILKDMKAGPWTEFTAGEK